MLFTPIFQVMELISGIIKKIFSKDRGFSFFLVYTKELRDRSVLENKIFSSLIDFFYPVSTTSARIFTLRQSRITSVSV